MNASRERCSMTSGSLKRSLLSTRGCAAALLLSIACVIRVWATDSAALKAGVFSPPRQAPEFSLRGSDGRGLKLSAYRGKVVVLAFGYTSCPEVCPTTLAILAQTRRRLGAAAREVQVLYVTVDPERDVAERMAKYLAAFDSTFIGGTGTNEVLSTVRRDYGIVAERKSIGGNVTFAHSSSTYLIDRGGSLRALMPYGRGPEDYVHDLKLLLQE
jgi:protein SCO1